MDDNEKIKWLEAERDFCERSIKTQKENIDYAINKIKEFEMRIEIAEAGIKNLSGIN
jgi:hypothetical protein